MLVLSRKKSESIVIAGNIEIEVLKIKGNTVRIGIKAPRQVKVLRGELASFDVECHQDDMVETATGFGPEDLERLPNPFVVAHAS